jgi:hypothetical protein
LIAEQCGEDHQSADLLGRALEVISDDGQLEGARIRALVATKQYVDGVARATRYLLTLNQHPMTAVTVRVYLTTCLVALGKSGEALLQLEHIARTLEDRGVILSPALATELIALRDEALGNQKRP